MKLQSVKGVYAEGRLILADPAQAPQEGAEIVVTYVKSSESAPTSDVIRALRGRGKGEKLVERLLHSRQEDGMSNEQSGNRIRP